jgi:hypothetical protein
VTLRASLVRSTADARATEQVTLARHQETVAVPQVESLSRDTAGVLGWAGTGTRRIVALVGLLMAAAIVSILALRFRTPGQ